MHDVMRNRIMRKLAVLPDRQLYQVLDFIEFLESKYAPGRAAEPSGLQRFAERLEDRMRVRTVAPRVIGGAMTVLGTAGRVLNGVARAGRELATEWESATASAQDRTGRGEGLAGVLGPGPRSDPAGPAPEPRPERRVIAIE